MALEVTPQFVEGTQGYADIDLSLRRVASLSKSLRWIFLVVGLAFIPFEIVEILVENEPLGVWPFLEILVVSILLPSAVWGASTWVSRLSAKASRTHKDLVAVYQMALDDADKRRLAEEAQRQTAEENEALAEIGRIISSSLDFEEVYHRCADKVRELVQVDQLLVTTIDRNKDQAAIAYSDGLVIGEAGFGDPVALRGTLTQEVAI